MTGSRFTILLDCGCLVFVPPDGRLNDRLACDFATGEAGDRIAGDPPGVVCPIHGRGELLIAIVNGSGAGFHPFIP